MPSRRTRASTSSVLSLDWKQALRTLSAPRRPAGLQPPPYQVLLPPAHSDACGRTVGCWPRDHEADQRLGPRQLFVGCSATHPRRHTCTVWHGVRPRGAGRDTSGRTGVLAQAVERPRGRVARELVLAQHERHHLGTGSDRRHKDGLERHVWPQRLAIDADRIRLGQRRRVLPDPPPLLGLLVGLSLSLCVA
jgi:hypothetical protein